MTRIVAGFARSLRLEVPRSGTRPTSDRVREAIFSALDARDALDGATVLDLYAGSGALGLEAASRGAARVVLVEKDQRAAAVCQRNASAVRAAVPARRPERAGEASATTIDAVKSTVVAYLERTTERFDVVFIDPPYEVSENALAGVLAALIEHLKPGAHIMIERSSRSPEPTWPAGIEHERRSAYGETVLWWARAAEPER